MALEDDDFIVLTAPGLTDCVQKSLLDIGTKQQASDVVQTVSQSIESNFTNDELSRMNPSYMMVFHWRV